MFVEQPLASPGSVRYAILNIGPRTMPHDIFAAGDDEEE